MNNEALRAKLQRGTNGVEGDTMAVARMMNYTVQTVNLALAAENPTEKQLDILNALLERVKERKARQQLINKQAAKL